MLKLYPSERPDLQLVGLQERIDILHERDTDYAVRLHNLHFINAELSSDRDHLQQELAREHARREATNEQFSKIAERLRAERTTWKEKAEDLEKEVRRLKERDQESVEGIWAAHARLEKIVLLPGNGAALEKASKRKADVIAGGDPDLRMPYVVSYELCVQMTDPLEAFRCQGVQVRCLQKSIKGGDDSLHSKPYPSQAIHCDKPTPYSLPTISRSGRRNAALVNGDLLKQMGEGQIDWMLLAKRVILR